MPHMIGIDIVEISRFARFRKNRLDRFLANNFTPEELAYCFSFKDAAPHLAGTFAAKEAVWKALAPRPGFLISSIEIRRATDGRPTAWRDGRRLVRISVSITHAAGVAAAAAIRR